MASESKTSMVTNRPSSPVNNSILPIRKHGVYVKEALLLTSNQLCCLRLDVDFWTAPLVVFDSVICRAEQMVAAEPCTGSPA